MLLFDCAVVDTEVEQELLVCVMEGVAAETAVVVDDGTPTARLQDAGEFGTGLVEIEPMHGLGDRDEVDGVVG